MMCFYKGSINQTQQEVEIDDTETGDLKSKQVELTKPRLDGIFPQKIEASIESIATNGPNMMIEVAKTAVDQIIVLLTKVIENMKLSKIGFSEGQQFLVQQLLSQVLSPVIDMLTAFQPYLNEAKSKKASFDLVPDELIVLVKALLNKAKEGKASPAELILVSLIKDVQAFFNSGPEDSLDNEVDDYVTLNVTREEVERLMERLLVAMPELRDLDSLENSDFNNSTIMLIRSQFGKTSKTLTARSISETLYPYLDQYSWTRMAPALEEIIQDPKSNKFLYENITDKRSSWWHATMGLLSGKSVKFSNYGTTMASMIGLGPVIEMWQVAQRIRSQEKSKGHNILDSKLTTKSKNMLTSATQLLKNDKENEEASVEALLRCLRLAGVVKKQGDRPEFTWFKLVEWLQVEYVEIFGSYMHHQPWYQFPFGGMLKEYFSILFKEMRIVFENHGVVKAGLSTAFLTDLIPGVVMSILFGQLASLALPLRAVLGDEYSPDKMASQFEHLVVTSNKNSVEEWTEVGADIIAEKIVDGLFVLKVPSLGKFTDILITLALDCEDTRILTVSHHTEVQVKLSITTDREEYGKMKARVEHIPGVAFKFDYTLPTVGKDPDYNMPHFIALGVAVPQLLPAVRELVKLEQAGVQIDQIYDFWN